MQAGRSNTALVFCANSLLMTAPTSWNGGNTQSGNLPAQFGVSVRALYWSCFCGKMLGAVVLRLVCVWPSSRLPRSCTETRCRGPYSMCFPAGNALHSCVLRNTGSYRKLAQPVNFLTTACLQGIWWDDSSLLTLPHMDRAALQALAARKLEALPQLLIEARRQPAARPAAA